MKKILLGCALLLFAVLSGQPSFSISGDPSHFLSVDDQCVDPAGNVYILGNGGPVPYSMYIIKFGPLGNVIWERSILDSGYNCSAHTHAIAADAHSIYISGDRFEPSSGISSCFILRMSVNGQFIWEKQIAPGYVSSTDEICTHDGGCVVAGPIYTFPGQSAAIYKVDSTGSSTWSFTIGDPGTIYSYLGVTEDEKGCIYACGESTTTPADDPCIISRISANGQLLWTHKYEYAQKSAAYTGCVYRAGKIYVTGCAWTSFVNGSGPPYYQLMGIMDTSGVCLLSKVIEDSLRPFGGAGKINLTSQNHILLCGIVYNDGYVREFDSTFNFIRGVERSYDPYDEAFEISGRTVAVGYEASTVSSFLYLSMDNVWTATCTNVHKSYSTFALPLSMTEIFPAINSLLFQSFTTVVSPVATSLVGCNTTINIPETEPGQDHVYPNPASSELVLEFAEPLTQAGIMHVVNVLGETVMHIPLEAGCQSKRINVAGLAEGNYFILQEERGALKFQVAR